MRRGSLAMALAVGISGCFEVGQGVMPDPSQEPNAKASADPASEPAPPEPTPRPVPRPLLPFVKRLDGLDRLFLFDALAQAVVEIPEAVTGGPILNPVYFEVNGEGRILYNSGAVTDCPDGSGQKAPDLEAFGAYVLDVTRRLRYRLSEDDYFWSTGTADGRLFAHLDVTVFPAPQRIVLVLDGKDAPFDEDVLVAELDREPGILVDVSMAAWGGSLVAVKGPVLTSTCRFPPLVEGRLYLYDLVEMRLDSLSERFGLPSAQAAALSPSGRQVIVLAGDQLLRLDRLAGTLDAMPGLNLSRGEGRFQKVRFLAGSEEVFYLEYRAPGGRTRILAYDWNAQRLSPLPMLNLVDDPADLFLAPP